MQFKQCTRALFWKLLLKIGIQTAVLAAANTSRIFIVLFDKYIVKVGIGNTGISMKMIQEQQY